MGAPACPPPPPPCCVLQCQRCLCSLVCEFVMPCALAGIAIGAAAALFLAAAVYCLCRRSKQVVKAVGDTRVVFVMSDISGEKAAGSAVRGRTCCCVWSGPSY